MKVMLWSLVAGLGLFAATAGIASANDPWDDDDDHHSDHCDHDWWDDDDDHDWWDDDDDDNDWWDDDDHDDDDDDKDWDDCDDDDDKDHDGHHGDCWDGGPVSVAVSPTGQGAISWVGGGIAFGHPGDLAASWIGTGFAGQPGGGNAWSGDADCLPPIVFAPMGTYLPGQGGMYGQFPGFMGGYTGVYNWWDD